MPEQSKATEVNAGWESLVRDLTVHVDQVTAALQEDEKLFELSPHSWQAPDDLGPLPPHMAERITRLLAVLHETQTQAVARRDSVAKQLRLLDSVPRDNGETAVYIDSCG